MSVPNPMEKTYPGSVPNISSTIYPCAGIVTTVYGLEELPSHVTEIACLWLLHPRLQTQACMAPIAAYTITEWNKQIKEGRAGKTPIALIAVSFDQRNHGSRLIDKLSNEAWRQGNPRHAVDMFSHYQGTSADLSNILTHLPGYLYPSLPASKPRITANIALGISLGGHAAWLSILHDPRVSAAVSIVGCPDYAALMYDRARLSKRPTYTNSTPPGSKFFGSEDFPPGLVEAIKTTDPAGLLSPLSNEVGELGLSGKNKALSASETRVLREKFNKYIKGKSILSLSGGSDKMVSPKRGEPFLNYLKAAIGKGGFFEDGGVYLEDHVYEGVGHEMTPEMVTKAKSWVCDWLAGDLAPRAQPKL